MTKLMAMLAVIARQHGIDRLEADVLAGNAPMLAVFERSGLPLTKTLEPDAARRRIRPGKTDPQET